MPRFGVSIIPSASGRSDPVAQARRAEELGFDLVSIWDHPHGENPSFETWTLMTWIAARTTRGGDHRHDRGVIAPVRTYEAPIDRRLEEAGFDSIASVNLLMKETLVRVAEPALVPAGVR